MAELLVKAKSHWLDNIPKIELDNLIKDGKITQDSYNARSQIGDIIVVRPDGWTWGKEECLPNYIVIKIPDLKLEDAKKYEESLNEIITKDGRTESKTIKLRKYQILSTVMDSAKSLSRSSLEIGKATKDSFITNITTKMS